MKRRSSPIEIGAVALVVALIIGLCAYLGTWVGVSIPFSVACLGIIGLLIWRATLAGTLWKTARYMLILIGVSSTAIAVMYIISPPRDTSDLLLTPHPVETLPPFPTREPTFAPYSAPHTAPVLHPATPVPFLFGGGTLCRDGTYSSSTGRGTCSHHGGISR